MGRFDAVNSGGGGDGAGRRRAVTPSDHVIPRTVVVVIGECREEVEGDVGIDHLVVPGAYYRLRAMTGCAAGVGECLAFDGNELPIVARRMQREARDGTCRAVRGSC